MLRRIRWSDADVVRFLGCYLTEPKSHVVFTRPRRPLSGRAFAAQATRRGVRLALPDADAVPGRDRSTSTGRPIEPAFLPRERLSRLADRRSLPPARFDRELLDLLYPWYRAGYIVLSET